MLVTKHTRCSHGHPCQMNYWTSSSGMEGFLFTTYHFCVVNVRVNAGAEAEVGYESDELDTCTLAIPADGNQSHTDFLIFWTSN